MFNFFKRSLLIVSLLIPSFLLTKDTEKTKELQFIVNPADPNYFFVLNAGAGLVNNPTMRPQGSYFITNAYVFPGGTFKKDQSNYLVDKHGHVIDFEDDSIGTFYTTETMVESLDFTDPGSFPAEGTLIELSDWQIVFKRHCKEGVNELFLEGSAIIDNEFSVGEGKAVFRFDLLVDGGLGCNEDMDNNSAVAKVYVSEGGQTLINVKFKKEIEYKK